MVSLLQPYLALAVASIIPLAIGFLWYGKWLFLVPWKKMTGITDDMLQKGPPPAAFFVSVLSGFMYVIALRMFLALGTPVWVTLFVGSVLWLIFVFLPQLVQHLFDRRPYTLLLINTGYQLANILVICLIIGYWG